MKHGKQQLQFTDLHRLVTTEEESSIMVVCSAVRETFLRNAFRAHPMYSAEDNDSICFKNGAVIRFTRIVEAS